MQRDLSSNQFPRDLLVEDFLDGKGDDGLVLGREESLNLGQGVARVVEGDEEALLAAGAVHGRLELVDGGPAHLVLLLGLDGVPVVHKGEFGLATLEGGGTGGGYMPFPADG